MKTKTMQDNGSDLPAARELGDLLEEFRTDRQAFHSIVNELARREKRIQQMEEKYEQRLRTLEKNIEKTVDERTAEVFSTRIEQFDDFRKTLENLLHQRGQHVIEDAQGRMQEVEEQYRRKIQLIDDDIAGVIQSHTKELIETVEDQITTLQRQIDKSTASKQDQ